jgi:hypothetical protein
MICNDCNIICENPVFCNTDPVYHDPSIVKILMSHKCFTPELLEELVKFIIDLKLNEKKNPWRLNPTEIH